MNQHTVGLARALKERRQELGYTRQYVGIRMGFDPRYAITCYKPYEKGTRPRFDVLLRLAAALDLPPDELVRRAITERPDVGESRTQWDGNA